MDDDETWSDRRMLHYLCEMLIDTLDLSQITLTVTLRYTYCLTWDNLDQPHSILVALAFLRNVKFAKVCGVDRSCAARLETWMMKQERIENIWKMKTASHDWCE